MSTAIVIMRNRNWTIDDYWIVTFAPSLVELVAVLGFTYGTLRNKRSRWLSHRPGGERAEYLCDREIAARMLEMITQARHEILLCIPFVRAGREILDALVEAAQRGVSVRVVLMAEKDSKRPLLHRLDHRLIYMLHSDRSHAKLLVTDNTALVTSMNLTEFSLSHNFESGSFIVELSEVKKAREHFYRIYHH